MNEKQLNLFRKRIHKLDEMYSAMNQKQQSMFNTIISLSLDIIEANDL